MSATPLDAYMEQQGIKDAEFGDMIKRDRTIVSKLRRGIIRPSLETAAEIERQTKGAVAMQSWVASGQSAQPAKAAA